MLEHKLVLQGDVRSERGNMALYSSHSTFIILFTTNLCYYFWLFALPTNVTPDILNRMPEVECLSSRSPSQLASEYLAKMLFTDICHIRTKSGRLSDNGVHAMLLDISL